MQWRSGDDHYGAVAAGLHWTSAFVIAVLLATGFAAASETDAANKLQLLRAHAMMGGGVAVLTVMRLVWWFFVDKKPGHFNSSDWQRFAAANVHRLFYLVIAILVISGLRTVILFDLMPILLGEQSAVVPEITQKPPRLVHGLAARLLMVLIALHVAAALYHQLLGRNRILSRMGLGDRS